MPFGKLFCNVIIIIMMIISTWWIYMVLICQSVILCYPTFLCVFILYSSMVFSYCPFLKNIRNVHKYIR